MAAVVPPVPPVAPSSAALSTTAPALTPIETNVGTVPDRIQNLAHQIQLTGLIAVAPDSGSVTLNTVLGTLNIVLPILTSAQQDKLIQQLTVLFDSQKPLSVVVQPGNPPTQAVLLLPTPPNVLSTVPSVAQNNILSQAIVPVPQALPPLQTGSVLSAVVLSPPAPVLPPDLLSPNGLPSSLPPLPGDGIDGAAAKALLVAGEAIAQAQEPLISNDAALSGPAMATPSVLSTPLVAPSPNAAAQVNVAQPNMPVTPLSQTLSIPVNTLPSVTLSASSLPNFIQPGADVTLTVNAISLPGASPPVPTLPNQIAVTVTGTGPNGQVLVQAGNTAMYIKQGADAPVGSTLLVTVMPARDALMPLSPPEAGNFMALQQVLGALAQVDPQIAQQVMNTIIPQPNAALPGALLFFLSAFRQSDAPAWLGSNASDALTKIGRMELIAKLTQELSTAAPTVNDPIVGSWRSYPVPLFNNGQFQVLHFYVHNERQGQGGGKENVSAKTSGNSVRFLIDMRFSKLGAMQLDGFVRPKQMDMMVRSENILPLGLDRELRQTYADTLSAIGYAGALNFQTGRQNWLHIRDPARAGQLVT